MMWNTDCCKQYPQLYQIKSLFSASAKYESDILKNEQGRIKSALSNWLWNLFRLLIASVDWTGNGAELICGSCGVK